MTNPVELKYSKDHDWAKVEGKVVTLGITDHAQESLGDVVFVELPAVGDKIAAGESYGTVESVKAVSDIVAAVSGTVVAVNEGVVDAPDTLNNDPYGEGWLVRVEADDLKPLDNLLNVQQYEALLAEEEH
ncbi:Glycine cleavage system H-protein, subgroup [Acididesulfobacillus acetoxydans]|uniref:Glycine cleavage system H protein n=1 Tax=Acididesulfobacillus acetoxydans TaxID=1561005 RepID=A0A8S0VYB5_9FIRM|nr:glycine cleavage system protein GcvH [Acididesulfobacillus acetoxydans]CAA7602863.1 Glycine cleavage system H-protein, subgroup [Acididesulfobacillus acetoxydans]CEJ05744.1 Glycine cleavage system H protein [Acididesulfobacillus acetoxydans]